MNTFVSLLQHGLGEPEYGMTALRVMTGSFFALSGYNKLFNKGRHATIAKTMRDDKIPAPKVMEWFVPSNEFLGGIALALGIFSGAAAAVLATICFVAMCCEGRARVDGYKPINRADRVDDWLYLPEVVYMIACAALACGNTGFGIDKLF